LKRLLSLVTIVILATFGLGPVVANANGTAMELKVLIEDTDGNGSLSAEEARAGIPLSGTVNVTVDWGDGTVEPFTTAGFKTHQYATAGEKLISITGSLTHFGFTGNAADREDGAGGYADDEMAKIIEVVAWGNLDNLVKLEYAFSDAENLVAVPNYFPANVTDVHAMFIRASSFNDPNVVNWNVSGVQKFMSMFRGASSFNQPIGVWNTSSATDMGYMFYFATAFNQPLDNWDTSNVTDFFVMFAGASSFNQSLAHFDLGAVTEPSVFNLAFTNIDSGNLAESIVGWLRNEPATNLDLELNSRDIDSLARPAIRELEVQFGWEITNDEVVGDTVAITPSRRVGAGFSGLEIEDMAGPMIGVFGTELHLGETEDLFDFNAPGETFSQIRISNNDLDVVVDEFDYRRCERTADGVDVTSDFAAIGNEVVISCTTFPIVISGNATMEFEVTLTLKGSFIRVNVEVLNRAGDFSGLSPVSVSYGGDGFNFDSETLLTRFTDSQGRNGGFVHSDSNDRHDLPVGAFIGEGMQILDQNLVQYANNTSNEDEIWFAFPSRNLSSATELLELEMFFVDWYGPRDSSEDDYLDRLNNYRGAALEFAQNIVQEPLPFGSCLPMVMDGIVPEFVDECAGIGDPTPVSFVPVDADQQTVDVGVGASTGFSYLFENAATYGGEQVNALVTIESIENMTSNLDDTTDSTSWGELAYLDQNNNDRYFGYDDWYLDIRTSSISEEEARAQITIDFQDQSGNPVSIGETFFNVYDVDDNQFVEFSGFTDYFLTEDSILETRIAPSGWTRFEELNSISTNSDTPDPRTKSRVMVRYVNVSSITFVIGSVGNASAMFFDVESGLGSSWVSELNPTGDLPVAMPNLADPPPVADVAPSITDISVSEISPCDPTTVVITGSRLSATTVTVSDILAKVVSSSASELVIQVPAGLTVGRMVDLQIKGLLGTTTVQNAFTVATEVCISDGFDTVWTKRLPNGQMKFYAKSPIGEGKIQFIADGKEIAWIRAVDETDPKLSFASGYPYLVRTYDLKPGKNRLEIRVDGVRVWRVTYANK
jgi:surface protein